MRVLVADRKDYLADENTSKQGWYSPLSYSSRDEFYQVLENNFMEPIFVDFEDIPAHLIEENDINEEVWVMDIADDEELEDGVDTEYSEIYEGKAINVFQVDDADEPHEVLEYLTDYIWSNSYKNYESNPDAIFYEIASNISYEDIADFVAHEGLQQLEDFSNEDYYHEYLTDQLKEYVDDAENPIEAYEYLCRKAGIVFEVNYTNDGDCIAVITQEFLDRSGIGFSDDRNQSSAVYGTMEIVSAYLTDETYVIDVPFIEFNRDNIYGYDILINELEDVKYEIDNAL